MFHGDLWFSLYCTSLKQGIDLWLGNSASCALSLGCFQRSVLV